jgi:thioredoxin-related protein
MHLDSSHLPYGLTAIAVFLITAAAGGVAAEELRPADTHFFHESFGDLPEELALAREDGKFGVMVMFEANDCPWCERMMKNVMNRASVQDFFREHFQIVLINVDGDTSIVDFEGNEIPEKDFALKHNRIRATPTFLFFDLDGRPAARFTGTTKNVEEFMWLGEYVVQGHYKDEKFIRYKRSRRQAS